MKPQQELIEAVNDLIATIDGLTEERNQLKAQVNCLRMAVMAASVKGVPSDLVQVFHDALEATPEQCLAEVKAKAIEDAVKANTHIACDCDGYSYSWIEPRGIRDYVKQLREQAK